MAESDQVQEKKTACVKNKKGKDRRASLSEMREAEGDCVDGAVLSSEQAKIAREDNVPKMLDCANG